MEQDQPPPPYNLDRKEATFAEVVLNVDRSTEFQEALAAFREFLAKQEQVTLSKWVQYVLSAQHKLVLIQHVDWKGSAENTKKPKRLCLGGVREA